MAQVTILDDDGQFSEIEFMQCSNVTIACVIMPLLFNIELVFGFRTTEYEVREGDGSVMVEIFFNHGNPGDYQPLILISIHNGTATGQIFHI